MNKKRLTQLAEWLEAGAPHEHVKFNMSYYLLLTNAEDQILDPEESVLNACGTVCCIAGSAAQFFGGEQLKRLTASEAELRVPGIAQKVLGLTRSKAQQLFVPDKLPVGGYSDIDPKSAAKVIRNLIKTGKVDWSLASK